MYNTYSVIELSYMYLHVQCTLLVHTMFCMHELFNFQFVQVLILCILTVPVHYNLYIHVHLNATVFLLTSLLSVQNTYRWIFMTWP